MDIAWKIIAGIAALFLLVAGIFGFQNKEALKKEEAALVVSKGRKAKANKTEGQALRYKDSQDTFLATYTAERDKAIDDEKEVVAQTGEVKAETAAKQNQVDALDSQIAGIEEKLKDYANIDELIAAATKLKADVAAAEAGIANKSQHLELVTTAISGTREEITGFRELVARQNGGELAPDYAAKVIGVNADWEFVVINKGNLAATYHNAVLDVQRGGETLGQVRVTNVEQTRSAATMIDGSFPEGVLPQVGDQLVPAAPATEGLPGDDMATTDPSAAGPGESIILPPAAGGAPDPDDPFGAMGGGAPAAPAPGADDPFGAMGGGGGGGEGAAPAPAADGADPFGALKPAGSSPDPFQ